jgi:hypothetical protein
MGKTCTFFSPFHEVLSQSLNSMNTRLKHLSIAYQIYSNITPYWCNIWGEYRPQPTSIAMYFYFVLQNVYTINQMSEGFLVFVNDLQPLIDPQASSFGIIFAID